MGQWRGCALVPASLAQAQRLPACKTRFPSLWLPFDSVLVNLKFLLQRYAARVRRARLRLQSAGLASTARQAIAMRSRTPVDSGTAENAGAVHDAWNADTPWILIVDSGVPAPDQDSGSKRLVGLLRLLLDGGHRVAFISDDGSHTDARADALREMGVHVPLASGSLGLAEWVRRHGSTLQAAILCRHYIAGHWIDLVRAAAPRARIVFDTVDLHFLREQREARVRGSRPLLRLANGTQRRELALIAKADITWVVSHVEQSLLRELVPHADVKVLSNIIDADAEGAPFDEREGLLFVGGMLHPPNRDAAQWLATQIYPAIQRGLPGVPLHLVGTMTDEMRAMLDTVPGLRVHGHVHHIEPFATQCRIALAPLRFGAGVKGKINLSMSHGQPVVATSCAVEGMHLTPEQDVLVADDGESFAAQVIRLYNDAALWRSLAAAGRANVRTHFSPDAARQVLESSLRTRDA